RADLDAGRPREAALQARVALEALLAELPGTDLVDQRGPVGDAANAALRGNLADEALAALEAAVQRMEAALKRRRLGAGRSQDFYVGLMDCWSNQPCTISHRRSLGGGHDLGQHPPRD